MARTAGSVGMPSNLTWPPAGWWLATCLSAERWRSPKKKTAAVMLHWVTPDSAYEFEDPIFVTGRAVRRLNLVAQRVCGMPSDTPLDENDDAAASFLARYILDHATGKQAEVCIEIQKRTFMYESGPRIGQKGEQDQHKVSFGGYRVPVDGTDAPPQSEVAPEAEPEQDPADDYDPAQDGGDDDIPF